MTSTDTEERRFIDVSVSKGKGTIRVYVDDIPETMFLEAVTRGLKDMANTGLAKVTVKGLEGEELQKAQSKAMEIAQANIDKVLAGTFRTGRTTSAGKVPGRVMTEARRLAKAQVKAEIKLAGFKISHIPAKQITDLANQYLASEDGAAIVEQARLNIEAIDAKASQKKLGGLVANVKPDPKMVAADAKRTAERQALAKTKSKSRPSATA